MNSVRLGIVGCGAIAELGHLPACAQSDGIEITALVDLHLPRAQELARHYGVAQVETDYRAILGNVDAVIVATPPHLHAEHVGFFLRKGVHVLCEKPLGNSTVECERIMEASLSGAKLAVGHVRRFFFYAEKLKELIEKGQLGQIVSVDIDEGFPYGWPAHTDYAFRREFSPGGVLFDLGIHALDLLIWLLGPLSILSYGDDAIGGAESNVEMILQLRSDIRGRVRLSRTCERRNTVLVRGTLREAQANVYKPGLLTTQCYSSRHPCKLRFKRKQSLVSALVDQLADFVKAIREGLTPRATGIDGLASVKLVEQCYEQRRNRSFPTEAPLPGAIQWT